MADQKPKLGNPHLYASTVFMSDIEEAMTPKQPATPKRKMDKCDTFDFRSRPATETDKGDEERAEACMQRAMDKWKRRERLDQLLEHFVRAEYAAEFAQVRHSLQPKVSQDDEVLRCTVCGFVIDARYEATKPTVVMNMAGRTKPRPPSPEQITAIDKISSDECPKCKDYVGKCPYCHRERPGIDASQGDEEAAREWLDKQHCSQTGDGEIFWPEVSAIPDVVESLASLLALHVGREREACQKLAHEIAAGFRFSNDVYEAVGAEHVEEAIRSRGG